MDLKTALREYIKSRDELFALRASITPSLQSYPAEAIRLAKEKTDLAWAEVMRVLNEN